MSLFKTRDKYTINLQVRGTPMFIINRYLNREDFMKLIRFSDKIGRSIYEFNPDKLARRTRANNIDKFRKELTRIVSWIKELGGVIDEDYIIGEYAEKIFPMIQKKKLVKARLEEVPGKTNPVYWVVLEFPERVSYELKEKLKSERVVPYRYEVFNGRQMELKEIPLLAVKFDIDNSRIIRVAPFFYHKVKRLLEKHGYKIDESELQLPDTKTTIKVENIVDKLRPYQKEALEKWIENNYTGTIVMPTGAGKTWVALGAISLLKVPTAIFVPTIELAHQWKKDIAKRLGVPEYNIGILGGGQHDIGKPILVAVYDSGVKYSREIAKRYPLLIFDEGHHIGAKTFKNIAWNTFAPYRMTLSATVERPDQNEQLIFILTGEPVYQIDFKTLVEQGYLAPVKIKVLGIYLDEEERKTYYKLLEELDEIQNAMRKIRQRYYREYGYNIDIEPLLKQDMKYMELRRRALSINSKLRILEQKNRNKVRFAIKLGDYLLERGNKIFIFTNLKDQAKKIYEKLREKHGNLVALVTGSTSPSERKRLFELFREGRIRGIVTTTVLDEGIDVPDADAAIIVSSRAIKHPRQFVQRIGRIVRPGEEKKARIYIFYTRYGKEEHGIVNVIEELRKTYGEENVEFK